MKFAIYSQVNYNLNIKHQQLTWDKICIIQISEHIIIYATIMPACFAFHI
jgi:hypothetical protein